MLTERSSSAKLTANIASPISPGVSRKVSYPLVLITAAASAPIEARTNIDRATQLLRPDRISSLDRYLGTACASSWAVSARNSTLRKAAGTATKTCIVPPDFSFALPTVLLQNDLSSSDFPVPRSPVTPTATPPGRSKCISTAARYRVAMRSVSFARLESPTPSPSVRMSMAGSAKSGTVTSRTLRSISDLIAFSTSVAALVALAVLNEIPARVHHDSIESTAGTDSSNGSANTTPYSGKNHDLTKLITVKPTKEATRKASVRRIPTGASLILEAFSLAVTE